VASLGFAYVAWRVESLYPLFLILLLAGVYGLLYRLYGLLERFVGSRRELAQSAVIVIGVFALAVLGALVADSGGLVLGSLITALALSLAVFYLPNRCARKGTGFSRAQALGFCMVLVFFVIAFFSIQGFWNYREHQNEMVLYAEATAKLSSTVEHERIAALHVLESLALRSRSQTEPVARVLSAFVRGRSGIGSQDDVLQAIRSLVVISKRMDEGLHDLNLAGLSLENMDFSEAVFERADFRSSNLTGSSFASAQLRNAIFLDSVLSQVDFSWADLSGADFRESRAMRADFTSATMENVNMRFSNMQNARFVRTRIIGSDLTKAVLQGANFNHAKLKDINLFSRQLKGAALDNLDAENVFLDGEAIGPEVAK